MRGEFAPATGACNFSTGAGYWSGNHNHSTMKLLSFLSHATLISSTAFILGLAFDVQTLPLFGIAISSSVLLIAFWDYLALASRARLQLSASKTGGRSSRRKYNLPFAA